MGVAVHEYHNEYGGWMQQPDASADEAFARMLAHEEAVQHRRALQAANFVALAPEPAQQMRDRGFAPPSAEWTPSPALAREDLSWASLPSQAQASWQRLSDSRGGGARVLQAFPRRVSASPPTPPHPSAEGAARARLSDRLRRYALFEQRIPGDGNCQFAALADQLYANHALHGEVRARVVAQLQRRPEWYRSWVAGDYRRYCAEMARPGCWGDHVTLQAASDAYGLCISLLTSYQEGCFVELQPRRGPAAGARVLWLAFWAEIHYNSVYPITSPNAGRPEALPWGSAVRPAPPEASSKRTGKVLGSKKLHALFFS